MPSDPLLARHRAILCHYDSYSTALVFARWPDRSLLWPRPLPDGAVAAADVPPQAQAGAAMLAAVRQALAVPDDDLVLMPEFTEAVQTNDGPVHVHLLRFTTFDAPAPFIQPAGGTFLPLPALRGSAAVELGLLREVFNLIIGGGKR